MRPVKVAYDLDGVLAAGPPPAERPWRQMTGAARAARRQDLLWWYGTAAPLWDPPAREFWVVSARKEEPDVRAITVEWLNRSFHQRWRGLALLKASRTLENVIAYKSRVLLEQQFTDFTEDNAAVVRGVAKTVPACRVWLFSDGTVRLYRAE